jgi:hypothetical protein
MKEAPVLLVQCCHLPHFFYTAARLRERYPGIRLDALLTNHPQARFYAQIFPLFEHTWFDRSELPGPAAFGKIVLPLLTPGYRTIKREALSLGTASVECDFEGNVRPLSRLNLIRSDYLAVFSVTPRFREYLKTFPHRPMGEKVLLLRSCGPSLFDTLSREVQQFLPEQCEITRVEPGPRRAVWREIKKEQFDSAFVFFTGEKGFFFLKLLPFLLRVPKILVLNENGARFYASGRSLGRFLLKRLRYGRLTGHRRSSLLPARYVLLIQTADDEMTVRALQSIRDPRVARPAPVAVFCRADKKNFFETKPGVARVYTYEPNQKWQAIKTFWSMRRLNLEVVAALFTGEPIFRLQKLLIFLLPADNRLVFNRNLDCFYMRRWEVLLLRARESNRATTRVWEATLLPFCKALLFFPRFLFLVIWVTAQKLRRAYSLSSEVK